MTHYPIRYDDEDIWVYAIYRHNPGALWLGAHEHGVYKLNGTAFEPLRFGSGAR